MALRCGEEDEDGRTLVCRSGCGHAVRARVCACLSQSLSLSASLCLSLSLSVSLCLSVCGSWHCCSHLLPPPVLCIPCAGRAQAMPLITELLRNRADINAQDHRKQTPLHRSRHSAPALPLCAWPVCVCACVCLCACACACVCVCTLSHLVFILFPSLSPSWKTDCNGFADVPPLPPTQPLPVHRCIYEKHTEVAAKLLVHPKLRPTVRFKKPKLDCTGRESVCIHTTALPDRHTLLLLSASLPSLFLFPLPCLSPPFPPLPLPLSPPSATDPGRGRPLSLRRSAAHAAV